VVHYLPPKGKTVGRLYLTNYQIIFLSYDKSSYVPHPSFFVLLRSSSFFSLGLRYRRR
jgi:hypothetical protein